MTAAVDVRHIRVVLDGRAVLRDATLSIPAGRRTALIGPNGGGKTTLARAILGVLPLESGAVSFPATGGRPRIGYLPQRTTLAADAPLSGVDLVSLSLDPRPGFGARSGARREAAAALRRAGLPEDRLEIPVGRLSGGQRQRVLLARALAGSPPILLLDEPDTALDADGMKTLRRLVGEEVAAGRTVVYVTHDSAAMGGSDVVFRVDGTVLEEAA